MGLSATLAGRGWRLHLAKRIAQGDLVFSAMADILNARQGSERMARVRGRGNRSTEVALARAFRLNGVSGWRRHVRLALTPSKSKASGKAKSRKSLRPDFMFRPARVVVFVRPWEHDLKTRPDACVRRVVRAFGVTCTGSR